MALKVCGHRIMIKPDPLETEHAVAGTSIKIALSRDEKTYRSATDTGTVVQVGETAWYGFGDNRKWCKVGDKIQYARYSGKFVVDPENEDEFVIVNDDDVQVIIEKGKE